MSMTRRRLLDNTFKKSVVGNPAIATDSLARMYPGIVMQGWTTQDGTPTPETPVPIVSAGTQSQETGKWEYEITIANAQTDPDKNQTVTLTADRPLTKWDKLIKKNGVWGWDYSSGIYTVTGEEVFYSSGASYKGEETSDAWFINNEMVQIPLSNTQIGYCEQLSWSALIWTEANDGKIGFTFNNYQIHMRLRNSDIGVNAEDTLTDVSNKIKAYAAQKYQEGNPFIFLYETKEPVFTPLSASEQEQMNALHTFRPTTVLSNDAGCEMTLTYKTKKSLEVTD